MNQEMVYLVAGLSSFLKLWIIEVYSFVLYLKVSEPKCVKSGYIHNVGNSLRLGDLHLLKFKV